MEIVKESECRVTLAEAEQDARAFVEIARALDSLDRTQQLRVMEAVCVMLGQDGFAAEFRAKRSARR